MQQELIFNSEQSVSFGQSSENSKGPLSGRWNVLSDLMSQFGRYIAPIYRHERPERSIQMRLYTMQKGQHLLMFIMFLCLFFIALLLGMAGPKMIVKHTEKANISMKEGPYYILTPKLDTYRQMLWLSLEVTLDGTKGEKNFRTVIQYVSTKINIEGLEKTGKRQNVGDKNLNRTRKLECHENKCQIFTVLHLGTINYQRYIFDIKLIGLEDLNRHYRIKNLFFHITTYNPEFTKMEIWFRFIFLMFSVFVGFSYLLKMKSSAFEDWSIEQKWCGILVSLLINYNNPMFALTLSWRNIVGSAIDVLFQTTFLFGLLLFWLCIFHGLVQTDRSFASFYLLKIIIVGSMVSFPEIDSRF